MENTQLYDFELTDEEMEQIEALEKMRSLFWRMDKINYSDKPHYVATSGTCGLYRNPMLCEKLARKTRIFLK